MTGAFLRVKRNNKWGSIEIEYLTDKERKETILSQDPEELLAWLNITCHALAELTQSTHHA